MPQPIAIINRIKRKFLKDLADESRSRPPQDYARKRIAVVCVPDFHAEMDVPHDDRYGSGIRPGYVDTISSALRLGRIKISNIVPATGIKPTTASMTAIFRTGFNFSFGYPDLTGFINRITGHTKPAISPATEWYSKQHLPRRPAW